MKEITQYQANDGSIHSTAEKALEIDRTGERIDAAMAPLTIPEDIKKRLDNGDGWYQHNYDTVVVCRDAILDICEGNGLATNFKAFKCRGPEVHPLSVIGRILDDVGGPLSKAWARFARIDPQGREHQQCYFAYTAGPQPEQVQLNA